MVSPKQLDFSSSGGNDDSDGTLSRRKSSRTPSSKRTAPEVPEVEEETNKKKQKMNENQKKKEKKKKKEKTKTKLSSPSFIRIWNEEDELTLLKGFVDYKVMTGLQTKTDWDGFYRFLGSSIGGSVVAKYSKDQVHSKIRKLRSKYLVQMEKINQRNDPNFSRSSDSEIFGYSEMVWGHEEAAMDKEMLKDNGAGTENETARQAHQSGSGEEMLKEQEEEAEHEPVNDNEAVTENATARQAQQSESAEEMLKEQEEEAHDEHLNENESVEIMENWTARKPQQSEMMKEQEEQADAEPLTENRAAKITETTDGKEGHDDNDELCVVQDAFETLMSQGLSVYQKKMQLEKLLSIGTDKTRELSNEWKALCVEERRFNIKKLRFSTKLAEALFK